MYAAAIYDPLLSYVDLMRVDKIRHSKTTPIPLSYFSWEK